MNTIKDAKFIKEAVDFGTVVPVFKKVIWLDKKINKATLLCSALGYYEAYLNSQRVGKFIFAPGWTSYGKRLQYQEYDVTSMMEECNVLEIAVGNGMRFHKNRHENSKGCIDPTYAIASGLCGLFSDSSNPELQ